MESTQRQLFKSNDIDSSNNSSERKAHVDKVRLYITRILHGMRNKVTFLYSQGRDNQIHIWKLHIDDENQDPSLEKSIVYNALGFCKLSLDEQQDGR